MRRSSSHGSPIAAREQGDRVIKKVMADKRIGKMMQGDMPFDAKRMIFGGFKMIVSHG